MGTRGATISRQGERSPSRLMDFVITLPAFPHFMSLMIRVMGISCNVLMGFTPNPGVNAEPAPSTAAWEEYSMRTDPAKRMRRGNHGTASAYPTILLACISYTCEECREVHRLGMPCRCETTGSLMRSNPREALARKRRHLRLIK